MKRIRRSVVLLVLTAAAVLAATLPANASFADSAATAVRPAIGTLTVEGPKNVRVDTSCVTTTTVQKRTYAYDYAGNSYQVGYSETSSTASSTSNVESDSTVRTEGPGYMQYTLTRTIQDTMLYATGTWKASTSPGVTGYQMTAFLYGGAQQYPMGTAAATATRTTGQYDASVVNYSARLSVVTLTSYGWTAPGAMSNVVTC